MKSAFVTYWTISSSLIYIKLESAKKRQENRKIIWRMAKIYLNFMKTMNSQIQKTQ